jgi:hypothetical protein
LTPGTEAKYKKINEEFDLMMRKNRLNPGAVSSVFGCLKD